MGDRKISSSDSYPVSQAVFTGQAAGGSARQHNGNLYNSKPVFRYQDSWTSCSLLT